MCELAFDVWNALPSGHIWSYLTQCILWNGLLVIASDLNGHVGSMTNWMMKTGSDCGYGNGNGTDLFYGTSNLLQPDGC